MRPGIRNRNALLVHFFEDKKTPYFWAGLEKLVAFESDRGKRILDKATKDPTLALAIKAAKAGKVLKKDEL